MKLKPIIRYSIPDYPDKEQIGLNKALLYYRPKSWIKKPLIGLMLTALLATGTVGLSGCGRWGVLVGDVPGPTHLSDTDALAIIRAELEKAGFSWADGIDNGSFIFDARITKDEDERDLEYVSLDDYWTKYPELEVRYDYGATVENIKEAYPGAAIFTDPFEYTQEQAENALREQIAGFLEWLSTLP